MPEGDTIVWTARRLDASLSGKVLTRTDFRVPSLATTDLAGRESLPVATYGKHLFHRLSGGVTIHSHLKMEGRWSTLVAPHAAPPREAKRLETQVRRAERGHTTRALLYVSDALAVASKLGLLDVIPTSEEQAIIGRLGPDILAESWPETGLDAALDNLRGQPQRLLGEALLDQRNLAGLGTFWISEMLFVHGVLPWLTVAEVPEETLRAVLDDARRLMLASATTGVQSSTGRAGDGETKRVHARSGLPCVRCTDTVRVAMIGEAGRERTLFSCPTCQGGYAPNDDRRPQRPLVERPAGGRRRV
ncbi:MULTISPECIES: DNA-formamidopyrimidine glycosylase family protein [unclassified Dermacoccus]|uniref:DNA-formamidopyrimidine glycosylase family protein n=1 Tax=unclassified Dermacoccus TaxID=2643059 RepID=UPI00101B8A7F|nr:MULTISPECIES: DNA-formamidopyrimidine glycosylase family protein [unclassified Dermacoccus]MBZ4498305.1 Fpg/Nei family DNA glycosylase [Dermacoccus sp. Tok2021]RYI20943.1 Fpg/Nei family DNA glycosylase [Dermacoccus sp. 147Ba]